MNGNSWYSSVIMNGNSWYSSVIMNGNSWYSSVIMNGNSWYSSVMSMIYWLAWSTLATRQNFSKTNPLKRDLLKLASLTTGVDTPVAGYTL